MHDPFVGSEALAAGSVNTLRTTQSIRRPAQRRVPAEGCRADGGLARARPVGCDRGDAASSPDSQLLPCTAPSGLTRPDPRRSSTQTAGAQLGVQVWEERIDDDEIAVVDGMRITTPARTALDLSRRYPLGAAVAAVDALAQATQVKLADFEVLIDRYRGGRGIKAARAALELVDGGAQSPKETWLRLLLIEAGFPRPQTQIALRNEWGWADAYLDMGWEDIKVGVEYEGGQHQTSRYQYRKDIRRARNSGAPPRLDFGSGCGRRPPRRCHPPGRRCARFASVTTLRKSWSKIAARLRSRARRRS